MISNNKSHHCETLHKPVKVKIGDGTILEAAKIGYIKVYFLVYGKRSEVTLTKVFYLKQKGRKTY